MFIFQVQAEKKGKKKPTCLPSHKASGNRLADKGMAGKVVVKTRNLDGYQQEDIDKAVRSYLNGENHWPLRVSSGMKCHGGARREVVVEGPKTKQWKPRSQSKNKELRTVISAIVPDEIAIGREYYDDKTSRHLVEMADLNFKGMESKIKAAWNEMTGRTFYDSQGYEVRYWFEWANTGLNSETGDVVLIGKPRVLVRQNTDQEVNPFTSHATGLRALEYNFDEERKIEALREHLMEKGIVLITEESIVETLFAQEQSKTTAQTSGEPGSIGSSVNIFDLYRYIPGNMEKIRNYIPEGMIPLFHGEIKNRIFERNSILADEARESIEESRDLAHSDFLLRSIGADSEVLDLIRNKNSFLFRFYSQDLMYRDAYQRHEQFMGFNSQNIADFQDESGREYFTTTDGIPSFLTEEAKSKLIGLLPENCSIIQTKNYVFVNSGGQERKSEYDVVVIAYSKEDGEYSAIDPYLGIRGRGKSVQNAMQEMVENGVYFGTMKEIGTFYYEHNGKIESLLSVDENFMKAANSLIEEHWYLFMLGKWPIVAYWGWQAIKSIYDAHKANEAFGSDNEKTEAAAWAAVFTVAFGLASARSKPGKIAISRLLNKNPELAKFADFCYKGVIGKGTRTRSVRLSKWIEAGHSVNVKLLAPSAGFNKLFWMENGGLVAGLYLSTHNQGERHDKRKAQPYLDYSYAQEFAGAQEMTADYMAHMKKIYGNEGAVKKAYEDISSSTYCFGEELTQETAKSIAYAYGLEDIPDDRVVQGVTKRLIAYRAETVSELMEEGKFNRIASALGMSVDDTVELYLRKGGPADSPDRIIEFFSKRYRGVKSDLPSVAGALAKRKEEEMFTKTGQQIKFDTNIIVESYKDGCFSLKWLGDNTGLKTAKSRGIPPAVGILRPEI